MAWMKIELELPDKPEVHYISGVTGLEPDAVVGKLIRIWQWFDKHTEDGNALGVTFALPDRISGVTGFGEAMSLAGWLVQNGSMLTMPKFDRHNGESAKKRALTAERVAKSKKKTNALSVTTALPDALPKEDKRRYINTSDQKKVLDAMQADGVDADLANEYLSYRKTKKSQLTIRAWSHIGKEVKKSGLSFEDALSMAMARNWTGFESEWALKTNAVNPQSNSSVFGRDCA